MPVNMELCSPVFSLCTTIHVLLFWSVIFILGETENPQNVYMLESIKDFLKSPKHSKDSKTFAKLIQRGWDRNQLYKFPDFQDLKKIVEPFVKEKNCLAAVNNFRDVNLLSLNVPIFLRSFEPMVLTNFREHATGFVLQGTMWAPRNFGSRNISHLGLNCTYSKHFLGLGLSFERGEFCLRIRFSEYIVSSKPWNCQVQFHLLYEKFTFVDKIAPKLFWKNPLKFKLFPPSIPSINIVFLQKQRNGDKGPTFGEIQFIYNWMKEVDKSTQTFATIEQNHVMEIFATIDVHVKDTSDKLLWSVGILGRMRIFRICHSCLLQKHQIYAILTPADVNNLNDLLKFGALSKAATDGITFWEIQLADDYMNAFETDKINLVDYMMQHLFESCNVKVKAINHYAVLHDPVVGQLIDAYTTLWFSIMGNHTIKDSIHDNLCKNGAKQDWFREAKKVDKTFMTKFGQQVYMKKTFFFPYFPHDPLSNLRFLSCGRRGLEHVLFEELIVIFDTWTWVSIFVTNLSVSIFLLYLSKNVPGGVQRSLLSPATAFLEQGGAFAYKITKTYSARFVISILTLMAVVLSNAYKNKNVYNMITPREPLPYETFQQLVHDGFSIYTRTVSLLFSGSLPVHLPDATLQISGALYVAEVYSEVDSLVQFHKSVVQANGDLTLLRNLTLISGGIQNGSKVHPELKQMLITAVNEGDISVRREYTLLELAALEKRHLMTSFEKCDKVAVILPEYLCGKFLEWLDNPRKLLGMISFGKEEYSDIDWMFTIEGYAPPHLINGIKRISESGIWHRWLAVYLSRLNFRGDSKKKSFTATSMSGNIIIIFTVWMGGFVVALIFLVIECLIR